MAGAHGEGGSGRARIRPWELVAACGAVASAASICGWLGPLWWFFDLFSHFRVQYCAVLAVVSLLLLIPRRYAACMLFGLVALANVGAILPLFLGGTDAPHGSSTPLRALLINVNTRSGDPDRVARALRQLDPDLIVLEEVSRNWLSSLSGAVRPWPHSVSVPRDDNFGIALYSKLPFSTNEIREIGEAGVPSIIAELVCPGGRFTVIATHPVPPAGAEYTRLRNEQIGRLAEVTAQVKTPVLLMGDLNLTPWHWQFKRLVERSGLRDSSRGQGPTATWPTFLPLLLIPLDHCLHSPEIQVLRKGRGPRVGSDHYPLVVDFAIRPPQAGMAALPADEGLLKR